MKKLGLRAKARLQWGLELNGYRGSGLQHSPPKLGLLPNEGKLELIICRGAL